MCCPYSHIVSDNKLKVAYRRIFYMNNMNKQFKIPAQAVRCVVLVPHGHLQPLHSERSHPLTEESEATVKCTKDGCQNLIESLSQFGQPSIICGQNPASIMTAIHGGKHAQVKTTALLDKADSENQVRRRARTLLRETKDQPLVVAYGDKDIIRKLVSSSNPNVEKCRDLEDGVEAAVLFFNHRGKLIAACKQSLLATMAAA